MSDQVLLVIDPQNDYFPEGKYPLWNTGPVLEKMKQAIKTANEKSIPVILICHEGTENSPFFNPKTVGSEIHPEIQKLVPNAPVITKHFADSFEQTQLATLLSELKVSELLLCGMMTQNCITHTALSKEAESYQVTVVQDACTTADAMIHGIAVNALSVRTRLIEVEQI
ncbi:cysteine hydrolase family protein [Oceanospirillum sp.]|uniref:cysteine hydrolase family protein n=1 Tax=Oceanospirillum sp. TaxID=2021254 RepID=UPI003A8F08FC